MFNEKRSYTELRDKILDPADELKSKILKNMQSEIPYNLVSDYLNELQLFLADCEKEAAEVKELFRKPMNEVTEVEMYFSSIKDLVYGHFDYYSILQFVDGIYNGIKDANIKSTVDVDKFNDFMIHQAFGNIADDIQGLVDMLEYSGPKQDTMREVENYKVISTWNNLFNYNERKKIYEACYSAITWMAKNQLDYDYTMKMLFCYVANTIIDYSVYTALVYGLRIRGIYNYASQFVGESIKTESGSYRKPPFFEKNIEEYIYKDPDLRDVSEFPFSGVTNIFQITDEFLIKDPDRLFELRSRFEKLVLITSGKKLAKNIPSFNNEYIVEGKAISHNRFHIALKDNPLYEILFPALFKHHPDTILDLVIEDRNKDSDNAITNAKLKLFDSLLNAKQGLGNIVSPRQEFLNAVIHSEVNYKDINDCRDHLLDLYVFFIYASSGINWIITNLNRDYESAKTEYTKAKGLMFNKYLSEMASILRGFYGELMLAICQKATLLERILNALLKNTEQNEGDSFFIRTPEEWLRDTIAAANDATTCAVPDTTRMTTNQRQHIDKDYLQYLEACDDYCKSLPEFQNIGYFAEAFDGKRINEIINQILAMIKSLFEKAKRLFTTNQFKAAQKWVKDRKEKLLAAKFDKVPPDPDDIIEVLDYKSTIGTGSAVNLAKFKNFINSIKIEEITDLSKFREDCYKSLLADEFAPIFVNKNDNADKEKTARVYKSRLLYNNSNSEGATKKIKINTNALLKQHMATWVSTVDEAGTLSQQFAAAESAVNEITNSLKAKVVAYTNKPLEAKNEVKPEENKEGNKPTAAETNNDDNTKNIGNVGSIVSIYQEVLATAYVPLVHFTYETVINQYSYIQQIFSKSSK